MVENKFEEIGQAKTAMMLNYVWGGLSTWSISLGSLIYYWYPYMIQNNTWWTAQCPPNQYLVSTIGTS